MDIVIRTLLHAVVAVESDSLKRITLAEQFLEGIRIVCTAAGVESRDAVATRSPFAICDLRFAICDLSLIAESLAHGSTARLHSSDTPQRFPANGRLHQILREIPGLQARER